MTRSEIYQLIEDAACLPRGTVTGQEKLTELEGWDSLTGSEFRLAVNDRWEVVLSGPAVERCESVEDLVGLLKDKLDA